MGRSKGGEGGREGGGEDDNNEDDVVRVMLLERGNSFVRVLFIN
jgi:hypothetical protein